MRGRHASAQGGRRMRVWQHSRELRLATPTNSVNALPDAHRRQAHAGTTDDPEKRAGRPVHSRPA